MTTHTSGPWKLNRDHTVSIPYRGPHCCASAYGGTEANARLIAAAPDLLAACGDALDLLNQDIITPEMMNKVGLVLQSAIARAKGE